MLGDEDSVRTAELIIGELLSNVARHASGFVCLDLSVDGGSAVISVHDSSPTFRLEMHRENDDFRESGRGLAIIAKLASQIDITPLEGMGKCVSVRLNLAAKDDAFEPCARRWLRSPTNVCMGPRIARYAEA